MPAFQTRRPLRALFLHHGFPSRFQHLAPALAERMGVQVVSLGEAETPRLPGLRQHLHYGPPRPTPEQTHAYLKPLDEAVRRGQAAAGRLIQARDKEGLAPDIIVSPAGSGDALYVKDIFPRARTLQYCEFYDNAHSQDVAPGTAPDPTVDEMARLRTRNAAQLLALQSADWTFTPTEWQRSRYPDWAQRRMTIVHEGIDTRRCAPRDGVRFRTASGQEFRKGDPVISFAARDLERHRGIGPFLGALALMQQVRPDLHAVVVGGDDVSHGAKPPKAPSWREALLATMAGRLDLSRLHFTGPLSHEALHGLFRVTAAHVHLTPPLVLGWSMLEAMASGAVVIGSDTPPVAEVIAHGANGLLVPFGDSAAIARAVLGVVDDTAGHAHLAEAGRQTIIARYDLHSVCLPRQLELIECVAAGLDPEPT